MLLTHLKSHDRYNGYEYLLNTVDNKHYVLCLRSNPLDSNITGFRWFTLPQPCGIIYSQENFNKGIIIRRYSTIESFIEEYFEDIL